MARSLGLVLCIVVAMAFSQGCSLQLGQPQAPAAPGQPAPAPAGTTPLAPTTPTTTTIPNNGTAGATPTTPGALAVAITAAATNRVDGNITNASLPPALTVKPTSMKVDLLGPDGATVLGTATPDVNALTADAGGTLVFSITPATALTAGAAVSARATEAYPDPANPAATRVGTSSPVQVTAGVATTPVPAPVPAPGSGTTPPTTLPPPKGQIQIAGVGTSVVINYSSCTPGVPVQITLKSPEFTGAGPASTADANGSGTVTAPLNPAIKVGETLTVTIQSTNGIVNVPQISDGRGP